MNYTNRLALITLLNPTLNMKKLVEEKKLKKRIIKYNQLKITEPTIRNIQIIFN